MPLIWQFDIIGKKRKDASKKTALQGKSCNVGKRLARFFSAREACGLAPQQRTMNRRSIDGRPEEK